MSDLDYLDEIDWRKFPRTADGVLKVSQATRQRVEAWLLAQVYDPMEASIVAIVESRCGYDNFTATSAIAYGFDAEMKHRIYCCLARMARHKKIERCGSKGRYVYRFSRAEVKQSIERKRATPAKSALASIRASEVSQRYE